MLIDCDPQANSTGGLGFARDEDRFSTYTVLIGESSVAEAALETGFENLKLLPSSKHLIGANVELVQAEDRAYRLKDALTKYEGPEQLIVLDCPPALDLLTLNALVSADSLLIPMQAEYFALEGVSELVQTLDRVRDGFRPELAIEGVVLTMYDERTNLAQQVTENLREYFGEKLLKTTIPRNVTARGSAEPRKTSAGVRSSLQGRRELYGSGTRDPFAKQDREPAGAAAYRSSEAGESQRRKGPILALYLSELRQS